MIEEIKWLENLNDLNDLLLEDVSGAPALSITLPDENVSEDCTAAASLDGAAVLAADEAMSAVALWVSEAGDDVGVGSTTDELDEMASTAAAADTESV